jgi:predicted aminopeptidase
MCDRKCRILAELELEYWSLKAEWGEFVGYDSWFAGTFNNARLASVTVYSQWLAAFEELLARESTDLARFYAAVKELAALPREEREVKLRALITRKAGI